MTSLNVLVTGGSSASGVAVARALALAGHRVFTVGSDRGRITAAAEEAGDGVTPLVCDLASLDAVRELADEVRASAGPVDGVIHLVGGWRGATGIEDQPDEDWDVLSTGAVTTLRNVSRVFYRDLADSPAGRLAIVSSTAVSAPTAAAATYAAAKAAAEAWTFAVADGFRQEQSGATADPVEQHSAAVVFVVKALLDAGMRQAHPERKFPGYTDVEELAAAAVGLFKQPAAEVNGQRIPLVP
ncbi:SDR family NAD(P)-dependent oxidoreductase [Arthrobacter celericrescens]|uniref:SDR family NAD(P)-dependent oxidoreductase n=1 Tax=Arthrobacter celericrescens TaxID=2320851 RepID=UPI000EA3AC40|nr:SDR family NAD(P)-dependent oxidoreductase [Arthrobacter celericrescens]